MSGSGAKDYKTFKAFYPAYLKQHAHPTNRALHFWGTLGAVVCVLAAVFGRKRRYLIWAPVIGFGLAWIGHYFFERNRPASFRQPLFSLAADFRMFFETLSGRRKKRE